MLSTSDNRMKKTDDRVLVHMGLIRPRREEIVLFFTSQGDLRCGGNMHSWVWEHTGWAARLGVGAGSLEEGMSHSGAS